MTGRVLSPLFVGRESQCELLDVRLDDARRGQPGVVLVGGEAGVGKTRLTEEFTQRATAAGVDVLWGGCFDLGDDGLPFAPFSAALRSSMRAAGVGELVELADGGTVDRVRLYESVADHIEQLGADKPIVLVLEDLHWADRSTRELLGFLARTLSSSSVLIIGTYRSDELNRAHPLRPFLAELDRVRTVERIELPRLNRNEVSRQMAGLLDRDPTAQEVDKVFARSEGNPFFVEELSACSSAAALPRSLRDLMLVRVERLTAPAQRVLRAASVVGVSVPHRLIAAVMDEQEDELLSSLHQAVDSNLLTTRPDGTEYIFRHSLLRESLHGDLLPGEHTSWHARIATVLTEDPNLVSSDRWAIEVAHHWNAAHDQPRALSAAYRAAESAGRSHAYAEQLRMLERVLGLWEVVPNAAELIGADELSVTMLASKAAGRSADSDRALALASRAVLLAEQSGKAEQQALTLIQRGKWCSGLRRDGAQQDLRDALNLLPSDAPTALRAKALDALASILMLEGSDDEAEHLAREALDMARRTDSTTLEISALTTLGTIAAGNDGVEGLDITREALALVEASGSQLALARVLTNLSHTYTGLGQHEEAIAVARRGQEVVRNIGLTRTLGPVLAGNVADPLVSLGRLDEASAVIEDAAALSPDAYSGAAYLKQLTGWLALMRGDLNATETILVELDQDYPNVRLLPQDELPAIRLRAMVKLSRGDAASAFDGAAEPLRHERSAGHSRYLWPLTVVAAEALADMAQRARDTGDPAAESACISHAEWLSEVGRSLPGTGAAGMAWRTHLNAELTRLRRTRDTLSTEGTESTEPAGGAGEADDVALWQEVADAYAKIQEPWPRGRALVRAAEAAARCGARESTTALLREANELACGLGSGLLRDEVAELARRARIELTTADEDSTAKPSAIPNGQSPELARLGLTDREVEVLRGVAAGQTNRQIADSLFMSPKTASVHVSNILAKLNVRGRGEAAALAHRLRLFDDL